MYISSLMELRLPWLTEWFRRRREEIERRRLGMDESVKIAGGVLAIVMTLGGIIFKFGRQDQKVAAHDDEIAGIKAAQKEQDERTAKAIKEQSDKHTQVLVQMEGMKGSINTMSAVVDNVREGQREIRESTRRIEERLSA